MRSNIFVIGLLVNFLLLGACGNQKDLTNAPIVKTNEDSVVIEKISEEEFSFGVIHDYSETSGCGFIIELEDENGTRLLEPLELPDDFQKDNLKIKFSFTPSRRQSLCPLAIPITINLLEKI